MKKKKYKNKSSINPLWISSNDTKSPEEIRKFLLDTVVSRKQEGFSLPRHKASLTLTHNSHKDNYSSVEEAIINEDHGYQEDCWVSDSEKSKAIEENDCWTIQWYPNTPVGFCIMTAHSLETLLKSCGESE